MSLRMIVTTFESAKEARKMCELILEKRLAACVKISPASSSYWWKGRIARAKELVLTATTTRRAAGRLAAFIRENHPYEVPEVVETCAKGLSKSYERWVEDETG